MSPAKISTSSEAQLPFTKQGKFCFFSVTQGDFFFDFGDNKLTTIAGT